MSETRFATAAQAAMEAKNWPVNWLICRTQRHAWGKPQTRHNKRYRYYVQAIPCSRCPAIKRVEMNLKGHVFASWIEYPEGWLSENGRIAGDAMDALRLAVIKRSTVTVTVEEPRSGRTKRAIGRS